MKRLINFLNPRRDEFIAKHPDQRLFGFYWSLVWRFFVIFYFFFFIIAIFILGIGAMFE